MDMHRGARAAGAILLAALLVGGCSADPTAPSSALPPAASVAAATQTPDPPTTPPTPPPTATPVVDSVYTADDAEIAKLIRAGVAEAVPQLKLLRDMDPSKKADLFEPLGAWISGQRAAVAAFSPSSCTSSALKLFIDGLVGYDTMRKKFLAWKDWGAHGNAYPVGAPRETAATLSAALVELDAHCRA